MRNSLEQITQKSRYKPQILVDSSQWFLDGCRVPDQTIFKPTLRNLMHCGFMSLLGDGLDPCYELLHEATNVPIGVVKAWQRDGEAKGLWKIENLKHRKTLIVSRAMLDENLAFLEHATVARHAISAM